MVSASMKNTGIVVAAVAVYFGAFGVHTGLLVITSLISFLIG